MRRAMIVSVAGLALLGGLWALPHNSVLRNTSLSMDLGWYVRVPFAEPGVGDVVAFPVPAQARDLADKACIRYPLLKRVIYRHPNGDLYLAGDHFPGRSFDSRYYGAVPETTIIGVYTLVVESHPDTGEGTQDKPLRSEGGGCAAGSAKDDSHLRSPGETREPARVSPGSGPDGGKMVSNGKGLPSPVPTRGKSNYAGATRGRSGRVYGKDPSLKSAWRGASAIRGVVPKWVTAPPKEGRGHAFRTPNAPAVDRRREVTARLSYVPRGADYAGKVAGNAKYLGRMQAVDRGEADEGHERYLAREGPFFTASSDSVKAGQVAEACRNDPRQFRLIVAPEDGERMTAAEMKAFIRDYMARVERAVGARLGWAAVIHKADNAARENARHAHVIIRGRDLDGNVLRFAKPFVKEGFRTIARELTTEKLGTLSDRELERQRRQREQHEDRNKEWKRMEREGASMAEKRAFAREGRSKGREPDHSPSRFHKDARGQGPPHCPWRRSW